MAFQAADTRIASFGDERLASGQRMIASVPRSRQCLRYAYLLADENAAGVNEGARTAAWCALSVRAARRLSLLVLAVNTAAAEPANRLPFCEENASA